MAPPVINQAVVIFNFNCSCRFYIKALYPQKLLVMDYRTFYVPGPYLLLDC